MFFPEITGNKCMKFLQNVVFTTDLFFDNGLSGKKICYIQKQRIARCLYTPEKEMMFNIHQMHQYFQLLMDDLSFILCQLNRILLIPPHGCQQDCRDLCQIRIVRPHRFRKGESDKFNIPT